MKQNKIENKIITGGMIPKIESAIQTLESGVESILIANNLQKGTIIRVINDELSFNNYKRDNIEFVDANQNELIDKDNNVYLDFSSGIGVTNLGFNMEIYQAVYNQLNLIWHSPNLYLSSIQEEVAQKLIGQRDYLAFFVIAEQKRMRQLSNSHVKLLVSRKLLLLKSLFTAERTAQCLQQDRRKLQINLVRLFLDSNLLFLMILIHLNH